MSKAILCKIVIYQNILLILYYLVLINKYLTINKFKKPKVSV